MKIHTRVLSVFAFVPLMLSAAMAAPGAHGPNGEHLDAPGTHAHDDAGPRIETFTESFELVGHLQGGELSILIDRYDTNEPVLDGKLEVEFNGLKAPARFHAEHGDYAVDDAAFLKALAAPGKHALVFTLTAGDESDLLEGVMEVGPVKPAPAGEDHHPHLSKAWLIAGGVLAACLAVFAVARLRRPTPIGK